MAKSHIFFGSCKLGGASHDDRILINKVYHADKSRKRVVSLNEISAQYSVKIDLDILRQGLDRVCEKGYLERVLGKDRQEGNLDYFYRLTDKGHSLMFPDRFIREDGKASDKCRKFYTLNSFLKGPKYEWDLLEIFTS